VAKSVTTLALPAPINGAGVAQAGGSLAASTTYYYMIIAAYTKTGSPYQMDCESPPSAEFSVVTTATDKQISLTWDAVVGANRYIILRTTVSGDYATTASHMVKTSSGYYHTTNSFVDQGTTLSPYDWQIYSNGMPAVYVEGGSDSDWNTEDDIYNQMVADGLGAFCDRLEDYIGNGLSYRFFCGMIIGANWNNISYVKWGGSKQFLFDGYQAWGTYAKQTCGVAVGGDSGKQGSSFSFTGKSLLSTRMRLGGTLLFYSCKFIDATAKYYTSGGFYGSYMRNTILGGWTNGDVSNPSKFYNCLLEGTSGNVLFVGYIEFKNCFFDANFRLEGDIPPDFINCNLVGNNAYSYSSYNARMVNPTFLYSAYEMRMHGIAAIKFFTLVNPIFYNDPVKCSAQTNPQYTKYVVRYALNLKVVDIGDNPIENVSVSIKNKNDDDYVFTDTSDALLGNMSTATAYITIADTTGYAVGDRILLNEEIMVVTSKTATQLYVDRGQEGTLASNHIANARNLYIGSSSIKTDSNGVIPELELVESRYDYDASGSGYYRYAQTFFMPYTIEIKKPGYQTYKLTFDIDKKMDWVIRLIHSNVNIDQEVF